MEREKTRESANRELSPEFAFLNYEKSFTETKNDPLLPFGYIERSV